MGLERRASLHKGSSAPPLSVETMALRGALTWRQKDPFQGCYSDSLPFTAAGAGSSAAAGFLSVLFAVLGTVGARAV